MQFARAFFAYTNAYPRGADSPASFALRIAPMTETRCDLRTVLLLAP